MCGIVGLYLKNRGDLEAARPYLERCSKAPGLPGWLQAVVRDALRR